MCGKTFRWVLLLMVLDGLTAFFVGPPHSHVRSALNYASEEAHQLVWEKDPDWYQSFVVRSLGADYCQARFMVNVTSPGLASPKGIEIQKDILNENESPPSSSVDVSIAKKADEDAQRPAKLYDTDSNEPLSSENVQDGKSITSGNYEEDITLSSTLPHSPAAPANEEPVDAEDINFVVQSDPRPDVLEATSGLDDPSNDTLLGEEPAGDSHAMNATRTIGQNELPNQLDDSSHKTPTLHVEKASTQPEQDAPTEDRNLFAVYKGLDGRTQSFPIANLTKLGYRYEEISRLQSDALSILIEDSIPRPKLGLPPQWKMQPGAPSEVQVVNATEAKVLLENNEMRKAGSNPRRDSTTSRGQGRERQAASRPPLGVLEDDDDKEGLLRRARDKRQEGLQSSPRGRRPPPKRRGKEFDGSPKRIYNPRETRRPTRVRRKPDPPPPGAFWADMDTFRRLLRDEAALRMRVLGDGWEDVVRQESEWRLNLYKEWLWLLHNGIGGDSVAPPSRYERARRAERGRRPTRESQADRYPRRKQAPRRRTTGAGGRERPKDFYE